jgi:hypothetical protein
MTQRYNLSMVSLEKLSNKKIFLSLLGALNLFWFFALFPARMGADAVGLLQIIRNGQSTDWWTGAFYWFFRITSIDGRYPAITALVQLAIFCLCMIYFVRSLPFSKEVQNITLLAFFSLPIYGFFGMSIAHDLTQTAGIILLVAIEIRRLRSLEIHRLNTILLLASLLLITTHTGIVIFGLAVLRNIPYLKFKRTLLILTIVLSVFFLSSIGLTSGLNVYGNFIKSSDLKYGILLADVRCVAQHISAEISPEDWVVLLKISSKENWVDQFSCQHADDQINALKLSEKKYKLSNIEFLETYFSITSDNPAIVAMSHIQRARGVLPPLLFQPPSNQVSLDVSVPLGQGTNTALQSGPVFLHPSIDIPGLVNPKPKLFKLFEIPAQGLGFIFNQASWFWGWGGLWLLLGIVFLIKTMKFHRIRTVLVAFYPPIFMHLLLILLIPTSAPRYYMYSIVIGISVSIAYLTSRIVERGRTSNG